MALGGLLFFDGARLEDCLRLTFVTIIKDLIFGKLSFILFKKVNGAF
jgi:hypothetical protein